MKSKPSSAAEATQELWADAKARVVRNCDPESIAVIPQTQRSIPSLAKDKTATGKIESLLRGMPTRHEFWEADSRMLDFLPDSSVHLVVTSPPYWSLKKYNPHHGQLGEISDYTAFLEQLTRVWKHCFRVLVPGGRVVCVVGDVCLSRRKNNGRHTVVPLHASIQERCRDVGFDNLAPIIWYKIANASLEAAGNGSSFLGKPYEPNAVIKNDIEFILMERKPGGYRSPSFAERVFSVIPEESHRIWFNQIWTNLPGASTRRHPAPYPVDLVKRLIRMFSFVGDVILDPFLGSGTTSLAAWQTGRSSIGIEIDPVYLQNATSRFNKGTAALGSNHEVAVYCKESPCL